MRSPRGRLPLVLLALSGTLMGLVLLEVGARLVVAVEGRREGRFDRDVGLGSGPAPRSVVTLGQIIRRSANPRIVYELRPRLDVVFAGGRLTTSDAAYRGTDASIPKPPSTFRIVGIGDSYMFGQGVSDDETYLARLPRLLEETRGGRVDTVNLAVPGYNTVMEVETLRTRAELLQPDLVLIEIVGNDLDLPNFLWDAPDVWSLRRSFLFAFVSRRLGHANRQDSAGRGLTQAPMEDATGNGAYSRESGDVPDRYRGMVGLRAFESALADLAAFGRSRGIPVLALTHGVWFEADMLRALERNGIPVLVLRSALRQRARALGAPDYARSPLALSPTDLHPSALGHQVVAEELARFMEATSPAISR